MINKTLTLILYCLRWLAWAVHYLVIWPAGTLILIVALVFCLDKTTPGMVVVDYLQEAGNITDGQRWTWRECTKQIPAGLPASSELPKVPTVFSRTRARRWSPMPEVMQHMLTVL
ncbi:TPA: hypothetical protein PP061_003076 [Salmonella bongori]|uniref:Conjugative transfer protein n=1 Tax=Salmonella bongori N268-08 TaxID=1197719 RepID=S5N4R1_SALBN|nr:conjugal transfer protein TraP [Salmonella bongori]AGR61859.1 conjugative transfer protein [Salmonella bongori N268-08]ECE6548630.1 hypothetical protein [Salmonella bongori]ECI3520275.1 hypothetical protein [Salmonella bongori]EDP8577396.1 hypothetical protein [Salmonella bongori]EDP8593703.1 hypothetical protein [Salmonella bongori]